MSAARERRNKARREILDAANAHQRHIGLRTKPYAARHIQRAVHVVRQNRLVNPGVPGRTLKGRALKVAAYSGAKRLENLTPAEAIAHAAMLKAQADTLNAEAAQIRRWAAETEQAGEQRIGRRAA